MKLVLHGLVAFVTMPLIAQSQLDSPETQVRRTISDFLRFLRVGQNAQALALLAEDARYFSPGGMDTPFRILRQVLSSTTPMASQNRANLIRHVQFLGPDAALALGVWRRPNVKPPFDSGTFVFGVSRVGGTWKINARHEAVLHSPDSVVAGAEEPIPTEGVITDEELAGGWRALFDGRTPAGFVSASGGAFPSSWRIEAGSLVTVAEPRATDLRTRETFTSFEFQFEWKVAEGANSGVKYRLFGLDLAPSGQASAVGYEYQLADDQGDPGARVDPKQRSGALYGVVPVQETVAKPFGQWNQSRLMVSSKRLEHWLNNVKTVEMDIDLPVASPLVLQHHRSEVRFRNLKIRPLTE